MKKPKRHYKIIIELQLTATNDKEAIKRSIYLVNDISLFDETLLKPHLNSFIPINILIKENE
jgi:hypothetical protein